MGKSKVEPKASIHPAKTIAAFFIKAAGMIIFFCGVPGICVALLSYFIYSYVSYERKREVIDAINLVIQNDKASILLIYLIIGAVLVVLIYNGYWKGREKILLKAMRSQEKSSRLNQPESIND